MKAIVTLFALFNCSIVLACPYCVGTSQGGKDSNTTIVLGVFILAIYIPYLIIYRLIKKQKAFKATNDSTGPA